MRRILPATMALLALGLLAACAPAEPAPRAADLVAAADGSGSQCTAASPCTLDDALGTARSGETIALENGNYGDLTPSAVQPDVTITGAAGAVIGKLDLAVASTTWTGMTVTGGIYLDTGADATRLDGIHVDGSGVFVHADDVVIANSLIENGTSIDGVQVGGADGLVLEGSIVRGFGQGDGSDVHSDCVQLFDSTHITIRGNYLGGCDNAALIFSPGNGSGISDVTVEGNFLQGCVAKTDRCSQGTALDLRSNAVDVVVRNNTMLDGSVMVEALDGLVFDRNIVGYASNCAMPMTNSIVIDWNTGTCAQPDALGHDGNREGDIDVLDRAAGDLRLADPVQAAIEPTGDSAPATKGYGGAKLPSDQAGAGG